MQPYYMAIPKVSVEYKVLLTVEETCGIFGIGEHSLRNLIKSNPTAEYLLYIGTRPLIKRPLFENYIMNQSALHY